MMPSFKFLFAIALLVLGGCASQRPPDAQSFHEISTLRSGLATLYVYRPHNDIGREVWPVVFFNDQKVVGLKNESYTVLFIKPGKYRVRTEKSSFLSGMGDISGQFEIPNEGTYFLKLDRSYKRFMSSTGIYASPSFTTDYERWVLVSKSAALPEISQCYFIPPSIDAIIPKE